MPPVYPRTPHRKINKRKKGQKNKRRKCNYEVKHYVVDYDIKENVSLNQVCGSYAYIEMAQEN